MQLSTHHSFEEFKRATEFRMSQEQSKVETLQIQLQDTVAKNAQLRVQIKTLLDNNDGKHEPLTKKVHLSNEYQQENQLLEKNLKGKLFLLPGLNSKIEDMERKNSTLNSELSYYKGMYENAERLKEQMRGLEHQLEIMASLRSELSSKTVELDNLKAEKQEWRSFLDEHSITFGVDSPLAMAKLISNLHNQISLLKDEFGESKSQLTASKLKISELETIVLEYLPDFAAE